MHTLLSDPRAVIFELCMPALAVDDVGTKLERAAPRPYISAATSGGLGLVCACIIGQLRQPQRAGVRREKNVRFWAR